MELLVSCRDWSMEPRVIRWNESLVSIWIEFDDPTVGKDKRAKSKHRYLRGQYYSKELDSYWVGNTTFPDEGKA